jgi:hypothetical protein
MAYYTSVGVSFFISQTFASAKTLSGVSNANPALATSVAHGYADTNEVLLVSGWERANNGVFRVDQQSADTFQLLGLNSTNTSLYASGGAANSTTKLVSDWIELPQVLNIATSGGEPRNIEVRPVKSLQGFNLNDGFTPASISFTIGYDGSLANWATLLDISRSQTLVAYKRVGNGGSTYGYGQFSMSEQPAESSGAVITATVTFNAQGPLISYAT